MLAVKVKILEQKQAGRGVYRLTLSAPSIARSARPGQFLQVRVDNSYEPLLRRPFSIHRVRAGIIEVLYEVMGEASKILSRRKRGEQLDVIGPLGRGFDLKQAGPNPIIVAGGIGVAPLVFLAESLAKQNKKGAALLGARDKSSILCHKDFQDLGFDVKISTDNGSRGYKGRVTGLLKQYLTARSQSSKSTIYACGPRLMLAAVAGLARDFKLPAWVSLEEHMACGLGVCLGCAVETLEGYQRVCQEGPVFRAGDIIWEK